MAYPTNSYALRLDDVDRRMAGLRTAAAGEKARMAAGAVASSLVFNLYRAMKDHATALAAIRAFAQADAAFVAYVREQKANATLNVAAEFSGVESAVGGVISSIEAGFPKDANGYLLAQTWGAAGPVDRSFTPAQTAAIQTALQAVVDAIG